MVAILNCYTALLFPVSNFTPTGNSMSFLSRKLASIRHAIPFASNGKQAPWIGTAWGHCLVNQFQTCVLGQAWLEDIDQVDLEYRSNMATHKNQDGLSNTTYLPCIGTSTVSSHNTHSLVFSQPCIFWNKRFGDDPQSGVRYPGFN